VLSELNNFTYCNAYRGLGGWVFDPKSRTKRPKWALCLLDSKQMVNFGFNESRDIGQDPSRIDDGDESEAWRAALDAYKRGGIRGRDDNAGIYERDGIFRNNMANESKYLPPSCH
jgi:hypothetical protein